ncbi:hypothetical protein [Kineosporia succinea]|uniref:Uncharacterized protein n=1 Tax=Kineosporia succinea TaxID=84632 RepID=A0ABT9PA99_9ACTN|nr:hypothetical protein [Kineosporia succinea]MDP9828965.1 hypothetical protein [Kineosporia succinea]
MSVADPGRWFGLALIVIGVGLEIRAAWSLYVQPGLALTNIGLVVPVWGTHLIPGVRWTGLPAAALTVSCGYVVVVADRAARVGAAFLREHT